MVLKNLLAATQFLNISAFFYYYELNCLKAHHFLILGIHHPTQILNCLDLQILSRYLANLLFTFLSFFNLSYFNFTLKLFAPYNLEQNLLHYFLVNFQVSSFACMKFLLYPSGKSFRSGCFFKFIQLFDFLTLYFKY